MRMILVLLTPRQMAYFKPLRGQINLVRKEVPNEQETLLHFLITQEVGNGRDIWNRTGDVSGDILRFLGQ